MAAGLRVAISNLAMGGDYTAALAVGPAATPVEVLIDTGSSAVVVDGGAIDAVTGARTTNLAQAIVYGAGRWTGAIVETELALGAARLVGATVAVTYGETAEVFGGAQGILGLAYTALDAAHTLPADTWANRFPPEQVIAAPTIDLVPYFTQLEELGVVADVFALQVHRASKRVAGGDPAADPLNHGVLVLGAGVEATDLYAGEFTTIEVVHDLWYGTNLTAIAVGDRPPLAVAPLPASDPLGSNSIVDSGTDVLLLAQPLYQSIVLEFAALDPTFATALTQHAVGGAGGLAHDALDVSRWPSLHLTFQAPGGTATVTIAPEAYWQLDAAGPGQAVAYLLGDGGSQGGRSILGLPLLAGRYTVFDRRVDGGLGAIRFAAAAAPT